MQVGWPVFLTQIKQCRRHDRREYWFRTDILIVQQAFWKSCKVQVGFRDRLSHVKCVDRSKSQTLCSKSLWGQRSERTESRSTNSFQELHLCACIYVDLANATSSWMLWHHVPCLSTLFSYPVSHIWLRIVLRPMNLRPSRALRMHSGPNELRLDKSFGHHMPASHRKTSPVLVGDCRFLCLQMLEIYWNDKWMHRIVSITRGNQRFPPQYSPPANKALIRRLLRA